MCFLLSPALGVGKLYKNLRLLLLLAQQTLEKISETKLLKIKEIKTNKKKQHCS